jgi:hypothetical protein
MNWITQTEGEINQYREPMMGNQPVRVLHHMLVHMFQNTHAGFFEELVKQINQGNIHRELSIDFGDIPIKKDTGGFRTPNVNLDSKKIELPETFLSYLWGCIYSVYTLYIETIDYPAINKQNGQVIYPIRQVKIDEANALFAYSRSLVTSFDEWNKKELPNPEIYLAEDRNYVEQTNLLYTAAVQFILCHEFTHLKKHAEHINDETSDEQILEFELEADNDAIELLKKGISYATDDFSVAHRLAVESGAVCGMVSIFFMRLSTLGGKHPNNEDRLTNVLEKLHLDDDNAAWGMACIGLNLWDEQFGLNLIWRENFKNYREMYYDVVEQIKSRPQ